MYLKKSVLALVILLQFVGCSRSEKKVENTAIERSLKHLTRNAPRAFYSSNFTDKLNWVNGFNRANLSQFYFTIPKNDANPIKVGYLLKFALSGEAKVLEVVRGDQGPIANIFIKTDKILNPQNDGNPNPIYIKGIEVRANNFTDNKEWRNGVYLIKSGYFYFLLDKKEALPVKVGQRIRFAKSGDALVRDVFKTETQLTSSVFVGVDKQLDPVGDGCPNPILILL